MKKIINFLGREILDLGEGTTVCNFYGIKPTIETLETHVANINHHILLVDVSSSMCSEMDKLKGTLKDTLNALIGFSNNYVSIITYSGHGESHRILNALKCDEVSYKMAKIDEVIENEVYCKDFSIISEPLELSLDISKNLAGICNKHHILLFTDGCVNPTQWSVAEEEEKCCDLAKVAKNRDYFFNAIGFGPYYNREFLKKITGICNGTINHIDDIVCYKDTAINLISNFNSYVPFNITIDNNKFFVINTSKMYNGKTTLSSLSMDKENVVVVFDQDLKVNGTEYLSKKKKPSAKNHKNFLYSMTLYNTLIDNVDNAEKSIALTGDIALYNKVNGGYSFLEKGNVINSLVLALNKPRQRGKEGYEAIKVLSIEEEPICLLEVLQEIMADEGSKLLWDMSAKYKRITQKTKKIEDNITFIFPKIGYMQVKDIGIAKDKLNVNLRVEILGEVYNKENDLQMKGKTYKEYSIIKNGMINVDKIAAKLSEETYKKFSAFVSGEVLWNGENFYELDLSKMKTTNKRVFQSLDTQQIVENLYNIEELACEQWALNQKIKSISTDLGIDKLDYSELTEPQINARKLFRIDENGVYSPLGTEKVETDVAFEFYQAKMLEWKIEKFPKTKIKKEKEMSCDKLCDLNDLKKSYSCLSNRLTNVKRELKNLRNSINLVRISSGLINKSKFLWDNTLIKEKVLMDKDLNINKVCKDEVFISTKQIGDITFRQDQYELIVKCN